MLKHNFSCKLENEVNKARKNFQDEINFYDGKIASMIYYENIKSEDYEKKSERY